MTKKDVATLLSTLTENSDQLTRKHLKKIYAILIASGQYPRCPWCNEYIYNINDFTWDHITPKSEGGRDDLSNLQPMHKSCNNEKKENLLYQADYQYDIYSELEETITSVRVTTVLKNTPAIQTRNIKKNAIIITNAVLANTDNKDKKWHIKILICVASEIVKDIIVNVNNV